MKTPNANGNEVKYLLRSMITHVGPSPNCGHYTAIGEAANGQFFQFDDSSVRPISMQQVLRTASYVVFYEMTPASWAAQLDASGGASRQPPRPVSAPATQTSTPNPSRSTFSPQPIRAPSAAPAASTGQISTASASPRPSPQIQPRIINKIGVVSSAAKSLVSNAINDIAKTVNKPKTGLVPYDDDNDSSSENESKSRDQQQQSKPGFVPRAVTMKNLVEKPLVKALEKPVKSLITATTRNWTVTDIDSHNPSVHSDNSTGIYFFSASLHGRIYAHIMYIVWFFCCHKV